MNEPAYPLTTRLAGGIVPSNLSPTQFNAYKEEQADLRNRINARCVEVGRKAVFSNPMDDFSNYHVVPKVDGTYTIMKREKPIDIVEFDNSGHASVIASMVRTVGDTIGLNKKRGKYNDAGLLIGEDTAGLEVGELQGDGSGNGFYG